MKPEHEAPFYVGYLPTPAGLKVFLVAIGGGLVGLFAALALVSGLAQEDPGPGDFQWSWGPQTVVGRLDVEPYPVLHVIRGTEHIPAGRSLLLAGVGKKGVQARTGGLDGRMVQLTGIALKRGDIDALQVDDAPEAFSVTAGTPPAIATRQLGRWRLQGEICDGKCIAGAMRPGRGLAHRACANLCLIGGAPPVFVSATPVDGATFFLLADAAGKPLPPTLLDHVAVYVALEGTIERRGAMAIFKVTLSSLEVL